MHVWPRIEIISVRYLCLVAACPSASSWMSVSEITLILSKVACCNLWDGWKHGRLYIRVLFCACRQYSRPPYIWQRNRGTCVDVSTTRRSESVIFPNFVARRKECCFQNSFPLHSVATSRREIAHGSRVKSAVCVRPFIHPSALDCQFQRGASPTALEHKPQFTVVDRKQWTFPPLNDSRNGNRACIDSASSLAQWRACPCHFLGACACSLLDISLQLHHGSRGAKTFLTRPLSHDDQITKATVNQNTAMARSLVDVTEGQTTGCPRCCQKDNCIQIWQQWEAQEQLFVLSRNETLPTLQRTGHGDGRASIVCIQKCAVLGSMCFDHVVAWISLITQDITLTCNVSSNICLKRKMHVWKDVTSWLFTEVKREQRKVSSFCFVIHCSRTKQWEEVHPKTTNHSNEFDKVH